MTNTEILVTWKSGKTVQQVAKEYMESYNERAKRVGFDKINKRQTIEHVEPIIYEYETKDWRKKDENISNRPTEI